MRRLFRENGLSIVLLSAFVVFWIGQSVVGHREYNQEQYEYSLSLAFLLCFLSAIALHALSGAGVYNEEQVAHDQQTVSALQYAGTSRFWFESFQNWQSEFLAIALVVLFSIFLRQRESPESKPVDSPHSETGSG